MDQDNIIEDYQKRVDAAGERVIHFKKLTDSYSLIRLLLFVLFIIVAVFAAVHNSYLLLTLTALLFIVAFGWLVIRQSYFEQRRTWFENLKTVNENEINSITAHQNIYPDGREFADDKHHYSSDLDIFGPASFFGLINRSATSNGNKVLASWLNSPGAEETIRARQHAVLEVAGKKDWKMDYQAAILFAAGEDAKHITNLMAYLHLPLNLPGSKWLGTYCIIAPALLAVSIVAGYFFPVFNDIAILTGLFNLGLVFSRAAYIRKTDVIAGRIGKVLTQYSVVFEIIEHEGWQSAYTCSMAAKVNHSATGSTSKKIRQLSQLINKLNYHLNIIIGFVLNLFLLWDIRQIIAIENWKQNNQESLEDAFNVVAEFEALLSLAGLSINYPGWCMPEIASGEGYTLSAKGIAHPLIHSKNRIRNDYELNDTFKIDIITGSNMAGKSTFLRTLGINTVLALCGAPVCAAEMRVSRMTIISYMRIKDSLNESTSTFKAELDRLQMLLAAVEGNEKVYFLIDEMLRGTNSVDKYLGSKAVIEQLISKQGVGLVATHDLQIAHLEQKYPDYVRNFYFDIQVTGGEMIFDYKIKDGECKTFNAGMLLKQIGINITAD